MAAVLTGLAIVGGTLDPGSPRVDGTQIEPFGDRLGNSGIDVERLMRELPAGLFPEVVETLQRDGAGEPFGLASGPEASSSYRLENPAHAISARFDGTGARIWQSETSQPGWTIHLQGYGRGDAFSALAAPPPKGSGNRIEYRFEGGISEWFVNGPLGLQQGFAIERNPAPAEVGPLVLHLDLTGDVRAEVAPDGQSAVLWERGDEVGYNYAGLYAFDRSGARLPARLSATTTGLAIQVDDAQAVYPVTVDPFVQRAQFDSLDERWQPAQFARTVAIDGDTVAIAMPEYEGHSRTGAVFVFSKGETGWGDSSSAIRLQNPGRPRSDHFASSVAVKGDVIAVGAPGAGPGYAYSGAVYVYSKPADGWHPDIVPVTLTPPADNAWGWFGDSVAVDGDAIVVGAPFSSLDKQQVGAAYVFVKGAGGWSEATVPVKFVPPDGADEDLYGRSVAIRGATVAVGAPGSDAVAAESGAVYIYARSGPGWNSATSPLRLKAANPQPGDFFGRSVALDGQTLVVGAPQRDRAYRPVHERGRGFADIFSRVVGGSFSNSWRVTLTAYDGNGGDGFGWSVSVADGFIAIGSPFANEKVGPDGKTRIFDSPAAYIPSYSSGNVVISSDGSSFLWDSGATYVFGRPGGGWHAGAAFTKLAPEGIAQGDRFGHSVAIAGGSIVVGAPYDDNLNGMDAGSAQLFAAAALGRTGDPAGGQLFAFDEPGGDGFGTSVAMTEETLVVGTPGDADSGFDAGSAFVFSRRERQWQGETERSRKKLTAPQALAGERFGHAVAIADQTIVVGAPADGITDGTGSVYVFTRPESGWSADIEAQKLTAPQALAGERFGHAVAIADQTIVVGAPADGITDGTGSVYVFTRPESGWSADIEAQKLTAPQALAGERFGHAVAIADQTIVVGAPADGITDGTGSVYVFTRPESGWSADIEAQKLTAPQALAGERFGHAVAIADQTIVVGAPADGITDGTGSVYVFAVEAPAAPSSLTAADGQGGDRFGYAVAIDGAVIVAGAPGDDGLAEDSENANGIESKSAAGSIYAFRRPASGWADTNVADKLPATDTDAGDAFGQSLALKGWAMVAGMPGDWLSYSVDRPGPRAGSVRVFTWPGLFWEDSPHAFKMRPPDPSDALVTGIVLSADGDTAVLATNRRSEDGPERQGAYVYVRASGQWSTADPVRISFPEGESYRVVSIAVSENGDTIAVAAIGSTPTVDRRTPNPSAVFAFTRPAGGWSETPPAAKLAFPSEHLGLFFKSPIAVSGDTIVVGASEDDNENGKNAGAAFAFTRADDGWSEAVTAVKLTAPGGLAWARFGYAVDVSGNQIVIGAPGDDNLNGRDAGAAYVFTRGNDGWGSQYSSAKLVVPDGLRGESFGYSVAIAGDTVVVGAPRRGQYWGAEGAAYVFNRPGGGWRQPYLVSRLLPLEPQENGRFGGSVAATGELVIVGGEDGSWAPGTSKVFVFPTPDSPGEFSATPVVISDPHGGSGDLFAAEVSAGGDSIAVLAPYAVGEGARGEAYLFRMPAGGWDFKHPLAFFDARIRQPGRHGSYQYTQSVAGADGELVFGVLPSLGSDERTVAVYSGQPGGWANEEDFATLSAPPGWSEYNFGRAVAQSGGVIVVGTPPRYPDLESAGSAFVFERPRAGWRSSSTAAALAVPATEDAAGFGNAVAVSGETVVVGTRSRSSRTVYLYQKPRSGAWRSNSRPIKLKLPNNAGDGYFGLSVAIDGSTVLVGMPWGEDVPGAVYLYQRPSGGWRPTSRAVKLTAPDGFVGDGFGSLVAISGDTIVIGSGWEESGEQRPVYVFERPTGGWGGAARAVKLTAPADEETYRFGQSVAVEGGTIAVGAYSAAAGPLVYVFDRPDGGWQSTSDGLRLVPLTGVSRPSFGRYAAVHVNQRSVLAGVSHRQAAAVYVFNRR